MSVPASSKKLLTKPCASGPTCFFHAKGQCRYFHPGVSTRIDAFCVYAEGKCPYASCGKCDKVHAVKNMAPREVQYLEKLARGEVECRDGAECKYLTKGCMYAHKCRCGEWGCDVCA